MNPLSKLFLALSLVLPVTPSSADVWMQSVQGKYCDVACERAGRSPVSNGEDDSGPNVVGQTFYICSANTSIPNRAGYIEAFPGYNHRQSTPSVCTIAHNDRVFRNPSFSCRCTGDNQTQPPVSVAPSSGSSIDGDKVTSKYIGCYKEKGHNEKVVPSMQSRAMIGYTFGGDMTTKKCTNACSERGFKYAGLQYANDCFCDNDYGDYGKADNCNMPCTGNNNEMCGGAWANSVYELGSK